VASCAIFIVCGAAGMLPVLKIGRGSKTKIRVHPENPRPNIFIVIGAVGMLPDE
jgi:hypothetical protein